jgi:hypothetical protein
MTSPWPGARLHTETRGAGSCAGRLVLAVGRQSPEEGQLASRPNLVLARELGLDPLEVPGGHRVYLEDPAGFAAAVEGAIGLLAWET